MSAAFGRYKSESIPIDTVWDVSCTANNAHPLQPLCAAMCDAIDKGAGGCPPTQRAAIMAVMKQALADAKQFGYA